MAPEVNRRSSLSSERTSSSRSIGFTIVGEGDEVRILPIGAEMISTMRRSSRVLVSLDVVELDGSASGWTCSLCSYENVDGSNNMCSVCGSQRARECESTVTSQNEGLHSPSFDGDGAVEEKNDSREELHGSNLTTKQSNIKNEVSDNKEALSEKEDGLSVSTESSKKTTTSFQELMSMSFANWSLSDNGPWQCKSCTYLNQEVLHLICAVCGEARAKSSNELSGHQSMTDFFNASKGSAEAMRLAGTDVVFSELGDRLAERERMNEVIANQFRILSGLKSEHETRGTGGDSPGQNSGSDGATLEETRRQLSESQRTVSRLESLLAQERREQELAEEAQRRRLLDLQRSTAVQPRVDGNRGASSTAAMELMAQQRLLDDWKNNWEAREQQLEYVRMQQRNLLERYQCFE